MGRIDAWSKATGQSRYVADFELPGMVHAAMARSEMAHARIVSIDTSEAEALPGVIGVYTASDLSDGLYGRSLIDTPLLARDRVRFVGERVVAVVAESRELAELAASMVVIEYEELPALFSIDEALAPGAIAIHENPAAYVGAVVKEGAGNNVIYHHLHGDEEELERALSGAVHRIDLTYRTQGVHQGYLEPQACLAYYESPQSVRIWLTNKAPYRVRDMVGNCLGIDPAAIELEAITLGGDFGGKGSAQDAPICVELSRRIGRPVRSVLRYSEDLTAANPRHPSEIRVRVGCDAEGRLVAFGIQARVNAGAYGSFTPNGAGPHGAVEVPSYRIPVFFSEMTRVYTNTVPRGNMRAPGGPQGMFAIESAMDELAHEAGIDPITLRRVNLLETGEFDSGHHDWVEHRGELTLAAALEAYRDVPVPEGWLHGRGISLYSRGTTTSVSTSMRISPLEDDCICVETPLVETGTGSHTVLREMIADQLGFAPEKVQVVGVSTGELPREAGAGGSRVTAGFAAAVDEAAKAWHNRLRDEPIVVDVHGEITPSVGSYTIQIAQVAVDPETGEMRVLELMNVVDVAAIINPAAHQMQIDGGSTMGFGYACLEDLDESEGHVWAANLGEYKLPSSRDVPAYRTVHVPGAVGVGTANVKNIGESTTPPVAPAIANALFAATGVRLRELPLKPERIYEQLRAATPSR
jgi:CO/xanthine dehydrogenase Mo-binding subunit